MSRCYFSIFLVMSIACHVTTRTVSVFPDEENVARVLIELLDKKYATKKSQEAFSTYFYNIDVNRDNLNKMIAGIVDTGRFLKQAQRKLSSYDWLNFKNTTLKRLFRKMNSIGSAILPDRKFVSYLDLLVTLKKRYFESSVCRYNDDSGTDCSVRLPEISNIMATSADPDELLYYWIAWRNATGPPAVEELHQLYEIDNEIAVLSNFSNAANMWTSDYDSLTFEDDVMNIWSDIKPLYTQLHAYVRRKLRETYGDEAIGEESTIPAHLLGSMWGQKWFVYELTSPYPLNGYPNITDLLLKKNFTVKRMAEVAESFFQSLNLTKLDPTFWKKCILEKPEGKEIHCQATAWDMFTGKDYRLKMCLKVTGTDFLTLHHELAHIHYFMEYKKQPTVYREELNPGFHEAVGDTIVLSAMTPRHLKNVGLLADHVEDNQAVINFLFYEALQKIAQLPYALVMDLHRWNIFKGSYSLDKHNCEWWMLREKFQGISAPVKRTSKDYDPASKYHVIANRPYISHFVSIIQQFQLFEAMCIKADQYDPMKSADPSKRLHDCDFSRSTGVGEGFKQILELGSSQSWQRVMETFTGEGKLSAKPLLNYFRPLREYLEYENRKSGEFIGWHETYNLCQSSLEHKTKRSREPDRADA